MQNFKTKNTRGRTNTCQYVILHHTGTKPGTVRGIINGFTLGALSCHYVVDELGLTYSFNKDEDVLFHAGVSSWGKLTDMNKYSIGIEVIGPDEKGGFTMEQKIAVKGLIRDLMKKHHIPKENVLRHKDIAPKRKVDIADSFRSPKYPNRKAYQDSL